MKFNKIYSREMERCYSVANMNIDGEPHAFFATEGREGGCIAVNLQNVNDTKTIFTEPGGTMGMSKLAGHENEFLCGVEFYSLANWDKAGVSWATREGDSYALHDLFHTPYLHRFGVLQRNGISYFVGCSLAAHKETKEDFSHSGSVFVAKLPNKAGELISPIEICSGFYKNHGFKCVTWHGNESAMISCEGGVYVLTPPAQETDIWSIEKIMSQATSDIAIIDIDGDGEEEIATIEPFHGEHFCIYKKNDDKYIKVFEHPEKTEFYHVAESATVHGKPVFIGGCRRGKQQLFIVLWNAIINDFEIQTVEDAVGPSNAIVAHVNGKELLISANREKAEAAIYEIVE